MSGRDIWSQVKSRTLLMKEEVNYIKVGDKSVDLKETNELYGRFVVLARSNRDIDQRNAVGN